MPKQPYVGREARLPYARMAHSVAALGTWERDWERDYPRVYAAWREHPSVGYFPGKGWNPEGFRTIGFAVAHRYLTARDAYWAAKVITSFSSLNLPAMTETTESISSFSGWPWPRRLRLSIWV